MSSKQPLISIIIPCYNIDAYIEDCLLSICKQKNIIDQCEVLCLNDSSSDHTRKILDKYALKYSFIKPYNNIENRGVSVTRNLGLEYASGKAIMFVDGDDTIGGKVNKQNEIHGLDLHYLKRLYKELTENKDTAMVVSEVINHSETDRSINRTSGANCEINASLYNKNIQNTPVDALNLLDQRVSSCGILFRKKIIDKYELRFDPNKAYFEDVNFVQQYAFCALKEKYTTVFSAPMHTAKYLYLRRKDSAMVKLSRHNEAHMRSIKQFKNALSYYSWFVLEFKDSFGSKSDAFYKIARRFRTLIKEKGKNCSRFADFDEQYFLDYVQKSISKINFLPQKPKNELANTKAAKQLFDFCKNMQKKINHSK